MQPAQLSGLRLEPDQLLEPLERNLKLEPTCKREVRVSMEVARDATSKERDARMLNVMRKKPGSGHA